MRLDETRQDETKQDKTRQDKTRQDKTRYNNISLFMISNTRQVTEVKIGKK